MENNDTKELYTVKEKVVKLIEEYINNLDIGNLYMIGFVIGLIIVIVLIIKFRKKKIVLIITKEDYYKQIDELLNEYINNKDLNGIKELIDDASCSKETLARAKKVLEDLNKMI